MGGMDRSPRVNMNAEVTQQQQMVVVWSRGVTGLRCVPWSRHLLPPLNARAKEEAVRVKTAGEASLGDISTLHANPTLIYCLLKKKIINTVKLQATLLIFLII